jgi:hypothetical protein
MAGKALFVEGSLSDFSLYDITGYPKTINDESAANSATEIEPYPLIVR